MKKSFTNNNAPSWLESSVVFMAQGGSVARNAHLSDSDVDLYGAACEPLDVMFPNQTGYVAGFDPKIEPFQVWKTPDAYHDDVTVYSLVRFFSMLSKSATDLWTLLFLSDDFVLSSSPVFDLMKTNKMSFVTRAVVNNQTRAAKRLMFGLSERGKTNDGRKLDLYDQHGYNTKEAYHALRMLREPSDALLNGGVDLQERSAFYKQVRAGDYTLEEVTTLITTDMEMNYNLVDNNKFPESVDLVAAKKLLLSCMEQFYGNLSFLGK